LIVATLANDTFLRKDFEDERRKLTA